MTPTLDRAAEEQFKLDKEVRAFAKEVAATDVSVQRLLKKRIADIDLDLRRIDTEEKLKAIARVREGDADARAVLANLPKVMTDMARTPLLAKRRELKALLPRPADPNNPDKENFEDLLDRARQSSIREILQSHGHHAPTSSRNQIPCPFHGLDKHPSAHIYDDKRLNCFTCGKRWDQIGLLRELDPSLDFRGAVRILAGQSS